MYSEGSSTSDAKSTARTEDSGFRDHQACKLEAFPTWILVSFSDSIEMASSGRETSMSFFIN